MSVLLARYDILRAHNNQNAYSEIIINNKHVQVNKNKKIQCLLIALFMYNKGIITRKSEDLIYDHYVSKSLF